MISNSRESGPPLRITLLASGKLHLELPLLHREPVDDAVLILGQIEPGRDAPVKVVHEHRDEHSKLEESKKTTCAVEWTGL